MCEKTSEKYTYNLLYILYIYICLLDPSLAGEPDIMDARMRRRAGWNSNVMNRSLETAKEFSRIKEENVSSLRVETCCKKRLSP